jgi:hypothetical protein
MHSRSRRARAHVLLLASITSAALLALTSLGLIKEAGMLGRLSTSTCSITFVVMLPVLQLQVGDSPAEVAYPTSRHMHICTLEPA